MPADVIRNPMTETQVLRHLKEQTGTVYDNNHFYQKQIRKIKEKKQRILSQARREEPDAKVQLKDSVPRITEGDFRKLIERYPLRKAEIMTYLLKLHQTDMKLSKRFFEYLEMTDQANVLDEAVQYKNKTMTCFDIAQKCKKENNDVKKAIKRLDFSLVDNTFRQQEFTKTQEIIKELDLCDADTFPLLYAFKQENLDA